MYFIKLIFNEIFYRPLLNGLVFFTSVLPGRDLGLAVILLTLIIKIITFPLTHKMLHTQKKMKKIEPEIKKIYSELYKYKGIKITGAPKLMHLKIPKLFVMWDDRIKKYYGFRKGDSEEYFNFLILMQ